MTIGERESKDLQRAREYIELARPRVHVPTQEHLFLAVHDGAVMEFGEWRSIYHGVCLCGYRTLGFGDVEAAAAAVERHVEKYA